MDAKHLSINIGMAAALLGASISGGMWLGSLSERMENQEQQTKAQWQRLVSVAAEVSQNKGEARAAIQGVTGLKEAIRELKDEIRLLRTAR